MAKLWNTSASRGTISTGRGLKVCNCRTKREDRELFPQITDPATQILPRSPSWARPPAPGVYIRPLPARDKKSTIKQNRRTGFRKDQPGTRFPVLEPTMLANSNAEHTGPLRHPTLPDPSIKTQTYPPPRTHDTQLCIYPSPSKKKSV